MPGTAVTKFTPSAGFMAQNNENYLVNKRISQPLWDRINIPTTIPTTAQAFFAIPRGQAATIIRGSTATSYGKTTRDCNIDVANQTPQKAYLCVGVSLDYIPISPAAGTATASFVTQDVMTLKNGAWLRMTKVDDLQFELPCKIIPACDPFTATSLNSSLVSGTNSQGGVPMYKLPVPVSLPPTTNFSLIWTFDPPSTAIALNATMDLMVTLHCIMERSS